MPASTMAELGLAITKEATFSVTLADQRSIKPVGIVEQVPLVIQGHTFFLDFVVVQLSARTGGFPVLIGQPWL